MMLLILDFPEPLLPISKTFFFLGFLTSFRTSAGVLWLVDVIMSAIVSPVACVRAAADKRSSNYVS